MRNPLDPSTFYIPLQMGPAVIRSSHDIGLYSVNDGSPIDSNAHNGPGFAERFIHSEIYKKYAGVGSVVHSHNEDVLPFTILTTTSSSSPTSGDDDSGNEDGEKGKSQVEATYHMSGFLGPRVPIFDIAKHYTEEDAHDLLINTPAFGAALASTFGTNSTDPNLPLHTTILQRGHGFVIAGTTVQQAVDYAYYVCSNARVQTRAVLLGGALGKGVQYLSDRERNDCKGMNDWIAFKPWRQWVWEVDPTRNSMYENEEGRPPV
jgi:ribulose-5-phosphate 4-epimerase/fuculose-1-phosphate aldolase